MVKIYMHCVFYPKINNCNVIKPMIFFCFIFAHRYLFFCCVFLGCDYAQKPHYFTQKNSTKSPILFHKVQCNIIQQCIINSSSLDFSKKDDLIWRYGLLNITLFRNIFGFLVFVVFFWVIFPFVFTNFFFKEYKSFKKK